VRIANRLRRVFALLSIATLLTAVLPMGVVSATSGNPAYCDSDVPRLNNQNFGTEIPVIMVHGFQGNDTDWGSINDSSSFAGRINNIPGVAVAHRFDYDWSKWVNYKDNGPRLAKTIDCISQLSVHNGGKGKVIIVGYSMGGLVARDATGHISPDGQRDIAEEVGQAITIGTPHTGTKIPVVGVPWSLARGFMSGSVELTLLPDFSLNTVVHTIAGDAERVYYDALHREVKRENPHDDTLVSESSAHAAATDNADIGGGQRTLACEKGYQNMSFIPWYSWYRELGNAPCEHGRLIQDASNGVREDTITAIEKYASWLNTPPAVKKSFTVGPLTVTFDGRWINAGYGASGPNGDIIGQDLTNGTACTNCSTTPPPTVYPGILIANMALWCNDGRTMMECATAGSWTNNHVGSAPDITVGGRTPDSSIRFSQSGATNGNRIFWCFEAEKICIDYGTGADVNLEPSTALLDLLHSATWSD